MERNYSAAITALNTLQSNFAIVDAIRKSGRGMNQNAIPEMLDWCKRSGHEPSDFNQLNAIHVAGTKGKGSTSAFVSSILCQFLPSGVKSVAKPHHMPQKIGLYTSPHLRSVRERIQINNEPISEEMFAKYFFEMWDKLEDYAAKHPASGQDGNAAPTKPVYFRYLTLMAFHAFLSEKVDTAVIECGIGGEYDSTNILEAPVITAVTSLGIDHTAVLGETIEEIAWHKAGIFKRDTKTKLALTVDSQPPAALAVLQKRAEEKGVQLHAVSRHPEIENGTVKLGLAADFQKINASLAVAIAAAHIIALNTSQQDLQVDSASRIPDPVTSSYNQQPLPPEFRRGLELVQWGGRCETRRQNNILWHLDGGHTIESIRLAADWFASSVGIAAGASSPSSSQGNPTSSSRKGAPRILLFNQQTRDAHALATTLHTALKDALPLTRGRAPEQATEPTPLFTHALFCTNMTFSSSGDSHAQGDGTKGRYKPDLVSINTSASDVSALTVQRGLAETWSRLDAGAKVGVFGTIEEAVVAVRGFVRDYEQTVGDQEKEDAVVLVTGSLHLVGGVLEVLETL